MRPWEARFGLELDWEKLWRDQVFGAKVRPWEACFGPELDWEKLWRDQVFGVRMTDATMGGSFWTRIRLGKAVAGPGVRGQDDRDKWTQTSFFLGIQRRR